VSFKLLNIKLLVTLTFIWRSQGYVNNLFVDWLQMSDLLHDSGREKLLLSSIVYLINRVSVMGNRSNRPIS